MYHDRVQRIVSQMREDYKLRLTIVDWYPPVQHSRPRSPSIISNLGSDSEFYSNSDVFLDSAGFYPDSDGFYSDYVGREIRKVDSAPKVSILSPRCNAFCTKSINFTFPFYLTRPSRFRQNESRFEMVLNISQTQEFTNVSVLRMAEFRLRSFTICFDCLLIVFSSFLCCCTTLMFTISKIIPEYLRE